MKRLLCGLLLAALLGAIVPAMPALADAASEIDVTQYTYTIEPILDNYCYALYVRTDNPEPDSFQLRDGDNSYASNGYTKVAWAVKQAHYADVHYEDPQTYRVHGGYILTSGSWLSDGGPLILQQRVQRKYYNGSEYETYYTYVDTNVTVQCPRLINCLDAAIEAYTRDDMSFFEKLDAIQAGLNAAAVYPRGVKDSDRVNEVYPYPMLAESPYEDVGINRHYDNMYQNHEAGMLLTMAYPYVLTSASFPNLIVSAARRFAPDCEIESTYYHYAYKITYQGQSKTYGGAGVGSGDPIFSNRLVEGYWFDGSADDWFTTGDMQFYYDRIVSYEEIVQADLAVYQDQIAGDTFVQTIRNTPGTWLRIGVEGSGRSKSFAYKCPVNNRNLITGVYGAWVDGRYVGEKGTLEPGVKYEDKPNADVVVRNMRYTDCRGNEHVHDVVFQYIRSKGTWEASWSDYYGTSRNVPAEFTLTREQVEAMDLDCNTFKLPSSGLIYDGTAEPGTPFLGGTLTYLANNGKPISTETLKLEPLDLNEPKELASGYIFSPPDDPPYQSFKAWLIDGVEYRAGATIVPHGDVEAKAVWQNLFAEQRWKNLYAKVAYEDGFTGTMYCAFYDRRGAMVSLQSQAIADDKHEFTFSLPENGAATAKVFVLRDGFVPKYPAYAVTLYPTE